MVRAVSIFAAALFALAASLAHAQRSQDDGQGQGQGQDQGNGQDNGQGRDDAPSNDKPSQNGTSGDQGRGGFFDNLTRDLRDRFENIDEDRLGERIVEALSDGLAGDALRESVDELIDFENVRSPAGASAATPTPLNDQYAKSHGVRFGRGASVHVCRAQYDEFRRTRCPYPRAASGERAGFYETDGAGPALTINFDDPVVGMALFVNLTGGRAGEPFTVIARGYDANGAAIARSREAFVWNDDNFTWPYGIALRTNDETGSARIVRAEIELRREIVNNQPVGFLFDDLGLIRGEAASSGPPPVLAGLEEQDGPARVRGGRVIQGPGVGSPDLEIYPPAVRKRLPIDWDAVDADLAEQDARGVAPAPFVNPARLDRAEVPVLAPVDTARPARAFGDKDTIAVGYQRGGKTYEVYSTRLVTVLAPARRAPGVTQAITVIPGEKAIVASFSLYGASYSLTRYCDDASGEDDLTCRNPQALRDEIANLAVVVGAAAEDRP